MTRLVLAAMAAVTLAGCGGSETEGAAQAPREPEPTPVSRVTGRCPVTPPTGQETAAADKGFNYGNRSIAAALWPKGRLVAGVLPDGSAWAEIEPDGSIVAKLGWWRRVEGPLTIEGERLDADAPPLQAHIPAGYGASGFQPTGIVSPTVGC